MRILVSGATGRIGKRLVPALARKDWGLTLLVHSREHARQAFGKEGWFKKARIVEASLENVDEKFLREACQGVDAVVHLAAIVGYEAPLEKTFAVNVVGTRRLTKAAKRSGVKRFVLASSTSVYRKARGVVTEATAFCPANDYGESKVLAEKAVRECGVPFVILRPSLVYGVGFREGFGQVLGAVKGGKAVVIGSGKNRIGFVHVDDVVQALLLALERREAVGEDFIVSSGEEITQDECLNAVADALGVPRPRKHVPKFLAYLVAWVFELKARLFGGKPFLRREYVETLCEDRFYDVSKARRLLGFKPRVAFEDGLSEVASAFLSGK